MDTNSNGLLDTGETFRTAAASPGDPVFGNATFCGLGYATEWVLFTGPSSNVPVSSATSAGASITSASNM